MGAEPHVIAAPLQQGKWDRHNCYLHVKYNFENSESLDNGHS